jgi:hypothetical protein
MAQLLAYHGDPAIKAKYLARVAAHRAADEIIHGTYWEEGKGCAVGCTVHSASHAAYETELGIPRILARLEDGIFESMRNGDSMLWPERFLSAIEPNADLSIVWPQFAVWMLVDKKWGVLQFAKTERTKKVIQAVADAYQSVVNGSTEKPDWLKLRSAAADDADAADAAADAAAAADADAAYAAAAAAYAAAYAAAAAADAAAAAAADADAAAYAAAAAAPARRVQWRKAQADKLIALLATAPIVQAVR